MSDRKGYWDTVTRGRLKRRALLRGTMAAGVGAVALSLAACGGSGSGDDDDPQGSGLLSKPVDTSSQAMRGGILPAVFDVDTTSFNSNVSTSTNSNLQNDRAYSKLFKPTIANRGKGEQPNSRVDPDIFSSYEFSADGLTLTMRLRPEAAFDPRPPTNGRKVTTQDVVYSWETYKAQNKSRGLIVNEVSPSAPVLSLTAPDDRTIVMKLAFPSAPLLTHLSYYVNALYVFPMEADGRFNPGTDMRGSGPWLLDQYEPSGYFKYRRNPNWYIKDRPFLDGIDQTIVTEYASQLAQFRAGNIYSFNISSTDIVPTKKEFPDMVMLQGEFTTQLGGSVFFDYRPDKGSIWFDERLRQALSMSIDRTLYIEALNNTDIFTKEGIPVEIRWNSHVPCGQTDYWLDPQGKDLGEGAKYFKFDLAEARKLVKAATGKDKVDTDWNIIAGNELGQNYRRQAEMLHGMISEGPFNLRTVLMDYVTEFAPKVSTASRLTGGHDFNGAAYAVMGSPGIDNLFSTHYTSGGSFFKFEENYPNDPQWDNFMKQQSQELDPNKRVEIVKNFQRYAAQKMYLVPYPGHASGFNLGWNWVGNFGTFSSLSGTTDIHLWMDRSKMKA